MLFHPSFFSDEHFLKLDLPKLAVFDHIANRVNHSVFAVSLLHLPNQLVRLDLCSHAYPLSDSFFNPLNLATKIVTHH